MDIYLPKADIPKRIKTLMNFMIDRSTLNLVLLC